jgi:hypothetical protein
VAYIHHNAQVGYILAARGCRIAHRMAQTYCIHLALPRCNPALQLLPLHRLLLHRLLTATRCRRQCSTVPDQRRVSLATRISRMPRLALPLARLLLALGALLLLTSISAGSNPNLKYFGVWDAEKGCPGGPAEPQQHFDGYYHYPAVTIPTHQAGRTECPDGDCVIETFAAASHLECEAACNATTAHATKSNSTAKCVAALLARAPSGPMNCTLLLVGGPGVGDSAHDTYVATWAADAVDLLVPADHGDGAVLAAPNLTCQAEQSKWMNFLFTSADPLAIKRYHRAVRKRSAFAICVQMRSFNQDRLGTNIGETLATTVFSGDGTVAAARSRDILLRESAVRRLQREVGGAASLHREADAQGKKPVWYLLRRRDL